MSSQHECPCGNPPASGPCGFMGGEKCNAPAAMQIKWFKNRAFDMTMRMALEDEDGS